MNATDLDARTDPPRHARLVLVVLALAGLAGLAWLVHPYFEIDNETNDAALYILCAKSLLAGEGYAHLGEPFTIRPPGFSLAIAPLIAWRGVDFHALNLFVSLFGVACACLVFVWAAPRVGTWVALACALVVWLNPRFQHFANQPMSDVPGAAALLACLCVERWAAREHSWRRDLALGLCIAAATYLRSISVFLIPAVLGARLVERWRERDGGGAFASFARARLALVALVPFALLAPWSVRDALVRADPPAEQTALHSYSTAMWHQDPGDPSSPRFTAADIVGRVPTRAEQMSRLLATRMETSEGGATTFAIGAALLALLVFACLRHARCAELAVLAMLALEALYFAFQDRLFLPVWVLAVPILAGGAVEFVERVAGRRRARALVAGALLALAAIDFAPRRGWNAIEKQEQGFRRICARFEEQLAPDAVLASSVGWHYSVLLDRPVWSLFFAAKRANDSGAVEAVIERRGVNTVILSDAVPADAMLVPWFAAHYGESKGPPRARVFRVRP